MYELHIDILIIFIRFW